MFSLIKSQGQIVERIVRAKNGAYFKASFWVFRSELDDKLSVRLISAEPIEEGFKNYDSRFRKRSIICLPCIKSGTVLSESDAFKFEPFVSPYFNLSFLITSQPTRAPSMGSF